MGSRLKGTPAPPGTAAPDSTIRTWTITLPDPLNDDGTQACQHHRTSAALSGRGLSGCVVKIVVKAGAGSGAVRFCTTIFTAHPKPACRPSARGPGLPKVTHW